MPGPGGPLHGPGLQLLTTTLEGHAPSGAGRQARGQRPVGPRAALKDGPVTDHHGFEGRVLLDLSPAGLGPGSLLPLPPNKGTGATPAPMGPSSVPRGPTSCRTTASPFSSGWPRVCSTWRKRPRYGGGAGTPAPGRPLPEPRTPGEGGAQRGPPGPGCWPSPSAHSDLCPPPPVPGLHLRPPTGHPQHPGHQEPGHRLRGSPARL